MIWIPLGRALEIDHKEWTSVRLSLEDLMQEDPDRLHSGGGLTGVDADYHRVRAALIRRGEMLSQPA